LLFNSLELFNNKLLVRIISNIIILIILLYNKFLFNFHLGYIIFIIAIIHFVNILIINLVKFIINFKGKKKNKFY